MSNFFQSTNINAGKYYKNGIEIDLGAQGAQGAQGIHGAAANQGAQGSTGAQGIQGITGTQGSTGSQGSQGVQGTPAPSAFPLAFSSFPFANSSNICNGSIILWVGNVSTIPTGSPSAFRPVVDNANSDWYLCTGQNIVFPITGGTTYTTPSLTAPPSIPDAYWIIYLPQP